MVLRVRWSRCFASQRSLAVVLLFSVVAISLSVILTTDSFQAQRVSVERPFEINIDFDFDQAIKALPEWVAFQHDSDQTTDNLQTHTRTPDGLLLVNPDAPHPIFQLIREAEAEWEAKRARASTSLGDAVKEYRRRYRRAPPLGFDKWWKYVVEHDVQLPDEYDEIFEDIEPFWGFEPADLARAQRGLEETDRVVTVEKSDAHPKLEIVNLTLVVDGRLEGMKRTVNNILALLHDVEQDLPPFRVSISPHDNPSLLSDWRIKTMAREAAAKGTTLRGADLPAVREVGWIQACPPDSPARLDTPRPPLPSTMPSMPTWSAKTFIASHRDAMDPCLHPEIFSQHGQFLSHVHGPFPRRMLVPRFSLCATVLHYDIRPPVPYGWDWGSEHEEGAFEEDLPWEDKVDERVSWRGRTTGIYAAAKTLWRHGQRQRLVTLANTIEGNVSLLSVPENEEVPVGDPELVPFARVNPAWMDIAFIDQPISCHQAEGTCKEMMQLWEFRKTQGRGEEGRYKFILDVDGNGWSGRFKRLITSNALIFKATIYPEWYTSRIAPWVHYVPIQVSYADLYDSVAFFRVHDELAAKIASAGREWSRRFWRREDMTAYLYRLLLEFARVTSPERASMDYVD